MKAIFLNYTPEEHFIGHQFAEIYKDAIYHPYLRGRKDLTIVDLGAHIGIFSMYAYKYAKEIHAVEPASELFACIEKMKEFNEFDRLKLHKLAISHETGEAEFYKASNVTANSLLSVVGSRGESEKVKTLQLDEFLDQNNIKEVDFMKMDIEGAEARVIGGAGFRRAAPRIKEMIIELHTWSVIAPMQTITTLTDRGFEVKPVVGQDANLFYAKRK